MSDVRDRGAVVFGDLLGDENEASLRAEMSAATRRFGAVIADFANDFAFGTIWAREGLERKQRSLVVLGMLIALRQVEELKVHVGVALANGLTVREIEEVLYQSIPYVGFPAANTAKIAMREALQGLQAQTSPTT
jgi:4-carboxymuconolactone decarboxylase